MSPYFFNISAMSQTKPSKSAGFSETSQFEQIIVLSTVILELHTPSTCQQSSHFSLFYFSHQAVGETSETVLSNKQNNIVISATNEKANIPLCV